MLPRFPGVFMLAALALAASGCSLGTESELAPIDSASEIRALRPNILLIVVDTLRADHLTSYGYGRATSPALDALAARGVRFDRHRAQAPCTFPSMNSLLTSRPVETFFAQPERSMGIPADVPSVAELLRAGGYGPRPSRQARSCASTPASSIPRAASTAVSRHSTTSASGKTHAA